ncbi:ankryin [Chitinophaga alhagiae]|uniref:Ankryin n=1 Tax=Chitinophaga alhagiae TaxID=2203219 RepID=A0ABN5LNR0_9BACT|nr:ankyrin repeat domain-containing protein [Chitinophaga alhagiae]AWO00991.1 ankryin [Chitinophaga alhagiae]
MQTVHNPASAFIAAACVPVGDTHVSGTLDAAEAILAAHPEAADANIYTAAILGHENRVKELLAQQPALATAQGGPHNWDALTYLCFSRYLWMPSTRRNGNGHLHCARMLLEHGANANAGWMDDSHLPEPGWESVLYGAAGIAHHGPLTRLLLQYGADPNDGETVYHTPESYHNEAMEALVETGRLSRESINAMLLRKTDWHDYNGVRYLLAAGADPNYMTHWRRSPLQSAVLRDNDLHIVVLMMEHGGNPLLENGFDGRSSLSMAARRGRGDLLRLFEQWGVPFELHGVEALIAACALNDAARAQTLVDEDPALLAALLAEEGTLLAEFAGNGNTEGVQLLLQLGVHVDAPYVHGNGYFGIAGNSTALHVAAWRAHHSTLQLLLKHHAAVNAKDGQGRSALALAVLACTDSYWTDRRNPASVAALLHAGADTAGVKYPSGYHEVDKLLAPYYTL